MPDPSTIVAIEAIPVVVPIRADIRLTTAHGTRDASAYVLVRVTTAGGHVGLGEATVDPLWNGEDSATALQCIRAYLAPEVIGISPLAIEQIGRAMERRTKAHPFAKAAVEMACWDLAGRILGVPVSTLLGGKVRERIATKFVVTATTPERAAELARQAVGQGFQTLKVKVGLGMEEDIARVRAVRDAVGPTIKITVDANGGWSVPAAIAAIRRMEPDQLTLVEQPVAPGDPRRLAEVRRAIGTPIMADESVFTFADAALLVQAGAADIFSLYPGKHGGLLPARKLAAFAEVNGLSASVGSNLELGIASAAMAHLAAATPAIDADRYPTDIIGPLYHEHDVVTDNRFVQRGHAVAPEGPGLGVALDEAAVREYRVQV